MAMGDWLLERLMDFVAGSLVLALVGVIGSLIAVGVAALFTIPNGWKILVAIIVGAPAVALLGNKLRNQ
jgi:hypothetical protein